MAEIIAIGGFLADHRHAQQPFARQATASLQVQRVTEMVMVMNSEAEPKAGYAAVLPLIQDILGPL